jgi:hypothetical protein
MEDRSKQIEESSDELIQLIRRQVEDVLDKHFTKNGVKTDYDIRDDAVLHVYGLVRKKGTHDSKFQLNKEQYIRIMVKNYLFKMYLDIPN